MKTVLKKEIIQRKIKLYKRNIESAKLQRLELLTEKKTFNDNTGSEGVDPNLNNFLL